MLLAPKIIRMSWPKHWITTVRTRAVITSMEAQLPRMRSACWGSPLPIMMEARGAPPMLTRAAKAEMHMISGRGHPHAGQRVGADIGNVADVHPVHHIVEQVDELGQNGRQGQLEEKAADFVLAQIGALRML